MSNQHFLHCLDCNAVHHVTPFDTAPEFESDGAEFRELPRDDRGTFLDAHFDHRIGELISVDGNRGGPEAGGDPMTVRFIEVTDGREFFVIRASRRTIADPLRYEVLPRQLRLWDYLGGVGEALKNASPKNSARHYRTKVKRAGRTDRIVVELPGFQGAS